jgi:hypothetical protein
VSLVAKSFLKQSKDGNTNDLFQGSSLSSTRRKTLMSVVQMEEQVDNRGCAVPFMEEVDLV